MLSQIEANKHNINIFDRSEASAFSEGEPLSEIYKWHNKLPYKYVVLISACNPLLKIETIDGFVEHYLESDAPGLFGVVKKRNYFWDQSGKLITEWPEGEACMNTKMVGYTYEAAHCLYAGRLDLIGSGIWMGDFLKPGDIDLFPMDEI